MAPLRILVTGSRGFVGLETVKQLVKEGHTVYEYDLMNNCDIRDQKQLDAACAAHQIERILHLAAIARFADADRDPLLAHDINVLGTRNVALVAQKYHIPVVYASTGSVYMPIKSDAKPPITEEFAAQGNSTYGCTKRQGELYIQKFASPWIILRYAHLYGAEKRMHGLIGGYIDRIQRGIAPTLYGGKQSNDFTYIKDVGRANVLALTSPWDKWNQVYNIGTGEELTAEKAGLQIIEAWNKANPKSKFTGKVEKKTGREVDPARFVYDITKAKVMLGFVPEYNFKRGLEDMFSGPVVSPLTEAEIRGDGNDTGASGRTAIPTRG